MPDDGEASIITIVKLALAHYDNASILRLRDASIYFAKFLEVYMQSEDK
jgi:hypothetical protein